MMSIRMALLAAMVLMFVVAGAACDGDDDDKADDAGGDDDNDYTVDGGSWPDNPKPCVGWIATYQKQTDGLWGSLFYFQDGILEDRPTVGTEVFFDGILFSTIEGWAQATYTLYRLSDNGWAEETPDPVCEHFGNYLYFATADEGILPCNEPHGYVRYRDGNWTFYPLDQDVGSKMRCRDTNRCVVWNQEYVHLCVADICEPLGDNPEYTIHVREIAWLTDTVLIGTFEFDDGTGDLHEEAYRYDLEATSPAWVKDERVDDWFFNGRFFTINERYLAFSYHGAEEGTVIFDGNDEVIETDWPPFYEMAIAPGGSGLAAETWNSIGHLWSIEGWEVTKAFDIPEGEYVEAIIVGNTL